ncbi:unnamed protein product [Leptidea sinapis]|uniref:Uncharacterized protein n=1 Tax=Leptidea sinapis TaxID=189913 RepID=A0A5E4R8L3_9NEOP|nr:unnamed protein product [Leptidea sinapis]
MKVLQNIQNDLAQQKQDMEDIEENIKETINKNIDEKFNQMEITLNQLKLKIEAQQKLLIF